MSHLEDAPIMHPSVPEQRSSLEVVPEIERDSFDFPPRVSPFELDRICSLRVDADDRQLLLEHKALADSYAHMPQKQDNVRNRIGWLLHALCRRDVGRELPVAEETFLYRRNVEECRNLQGSAARANERSWDDPELNELLLDAGVLLALERRKVAWLEEHFYPVLYRRTIAAALGEVQQFLMKLFNTDRMDVLNTVDNTHIELLDDLTWHERKLNPLAAGLYFRDSGNILVRIKDYYGRDHEWSVYNVLVHELVHNHTLDTGRRYGLEMRRQNFDERGSQRMTALNEAVTEMIASFIAFEHLERDKTRLVNQRRLSLHQRAYSQYTVLLKTLFKKIPFEHFVDAMMNGGGVERLAKRFEQVYGEKDALLKYAERLDAMYGKVNDI